MRIAAAGLSILLSACQTLPFAPLEETAKKEAKILGPTVLPSRSLRYGANRALSAGASKNKQDYIYRNVASAFPDNGKKMMIQARSRTSAEVDVNPDSSPWKTRVVEDPENLRINRERFSNTNRGAYSVPLSASVAHQIFQGSKGRDGNESFSASYVSNFDSNQDDVFEPNNQIVDARDLGGSEARWLALSVPGRTEVTEGIQWDPDIYKIRVPAMKRQLIVDLRYQHYMGNLSLSLLSENGTEIYRSDRAGDDEFMNLILDKAGVYFFKVEGSNQGNRYDLKYHLELTEKNDDMMEENDSLKSAFDLTTIQGFWLSETFGEGVAGDDDYFKLQIAAGRSRLKVDLRNNVVKGDIDLQLLNSKGQVIASSSNIGDDEYIDFDVQTAGWYYLRIFPFGMNRWASMYDLKWSAEEKVPKTMKLSSAPPESSLRK